MIQLRVFLEIQGVKVLIGHIRGNKTDDACFSYDHEYLEKNGSLPVSLHLPLRSQAFSPYETRCFFEGLLPEGFTRKSVAGSLHVSEDNYIGLLAGLGRECLGAICILNEDETMDRSGYVRVSKDEIRDLAREGHSESVHLVTQAHLSLTGASGKVGLYYDEQHGRWYLPKGLAPSTHIVKQSHVRLGHIVTNEQLCMQTAARMGISVPESFIINTGEGKDEDVLFATKRYDRKMTGAVYKADGLPVPLRLHQEDFAQAMGIAGTEKYEKGSTNYLHDMFELLRIYSADPFTEQQRLWDMIIFDYLIGNTDNHVKNYSLLYNENLKQIKLAPAYDMISTVIYKESSRELAIRIGNCHMIDEVDEKALSSAAEEAGMRPSIALKRYHFMRERLPSVMRQTAEELAREGYPQAQLLCGLILEKAPVNK